MIFPHKRRRRGAGAGAGAGGSATPTSPRTAVPLRGLLLDGVWRCNCPERPPALKLQTKNHGVNHGRWFYTCQKDHIHRCKFFLWASDAEAREKLTLISNSRTEAPYPSTTPQTPSSKTGLVQSTGLLTPHAGQQDQYGESQFRRTPASAGGSASASAKKRMMTEDTGEFEWDDAIETEIDEVFESSQPPRQPEFGLPVRKTPRKESATGPGKRKRSFDDDDVEGGRQVPITPGGPARGAGVVGQGTPFLTPTPTRYKNTGAGVGESPLASSSDLEAQVSQILEGHGVDIPVGAREELRELFNRHEMKTKGFVRGRDISRIMLRNKDQQIAGLNAKLAMLEARLS